MFDWIGRMIRYPKINAPFLRDKRGKLMHGKWCSPEFEYLAKCEWEFVEKLDGTNIRIGLTRMDDSLYVEYGGRTDNADIPAPLLSHLVDRFPNSPSGSSAGANLGRWMVDKELDHVVLFGEGLGPRIQNGEKYGSSESFVLFDVVIGGHWLSRENVIDVANNLGLPYAPVVGYGTLQDAMDIVGSGITFTDTGAIKRWGNGTLKSAWGDFDAEGLICRPKVRLYNSKHELITTKIKAKDFK